MKTIVFSVDPRDSLDRAICLMDEHYIHHLPVIDGDKLVGVLSDRDLLVAVGWKLECERRTTPEARPVGPTEVRAIMSTPAVFLGPDNQVHSAARIMAEGKFHCLPIVADHKLVGLVTSTDILNSYCQLGSAAAESPFMRDEVRNHMRASVLTIGPEEPLNHAVRIMRQANIRHLPVVVDGNIVGMLSDRDVRRACGTEMVEDEKAQSRGEFYMGPNSVMEIMSRHLQLIREDALIVDAIGRMVDHQIGSLPVVRERHELIGLLTDTDVLRLIAHSEDLNWAASDLMAARK
jgi:acetoin utilization protein AcuB